MEAPAYRLSEKAQLTIRTEDTTKRSTMSGGARRCPAVQSANAFKRGLPLELEQKQRHIARRSRWYRRKACFDYLQQPVDHERRKFLHTCWGVGQEQQRTCMTRHSIVGPKNWTRTAILSTPPIQITVASLLLTLFHSVVSGLP